jgi:hypothetical protein
VRKKLLRDIPASQTELEELGREAEAIGISKTRLHLIEIKMVGKEDIVECGFPSMDLTSMWRVDGIQNIMPEEKDTRYRGGPRWNKNSCGLDCFLVAAVLLDVGRVQIDQVWEGLLKDASYAGKLLLTTVRKPWGKLSTKEMGQLRDVLRGQLIDEFGSVFKRGDVMEIRDLVDVFGRAVPQFGATWTTLYRCCDQGRWAWSEERDDSMGHEDCERPATLRHEIRTGIQAEMSRVDALMGGSLEEAIQRLLNPMTLAREVLEVRDWQRCDRSGCSYTTEYLDCVLDRPPPTLLLPEFQQRAVDELRPGMLQDLKLSFYVWDSKTQEISALQTKYALWGVIIHLDGKRWLHHFVLYANLGAKEMRSEWVQYDGRSNGGKITPMKRAVEDVIKEDNISLQIYYRIE